MTTSTTGGSAAPEILDSPRRKSLSLSHIVEMLLRPRTASESVTIRTLAKGERRPDVTGIAGEGETLQEVAVRVAATSDYLHNLYVEPFNGEAVATEGDVPF